MTVFLAFNEAEGLTTIGTPQADTTYTNVASVARAGFYSDCTATGVTQSADFAPISECWVHARIRAVERAVTSTSNGDIFQILDTAGTPVVSLRMNRTGVAVGSLFLDTPTQTIALDTGISQPAGVTYDWDFNIKLDPTSGFIYVYRNGSLISSETGNTVVTSGVTQLDQLNFIQKYALGVDVATLTRACSFGQVVVSSSNTLNCKLYTLTPTAGSINTWDTGAITDVDETNIDDTDKATTTTNGDEFTMDTSDTLATPTLPFVYTAVVQTFRLNYDTGSPVTKASALLNDTTATSTSYGTSQTLTTGLAPYKEIWLTDPADAGSWTAAKINNYEFGVRADT